MAAWFIALERCNGAAFNIAGPFPAEDRWEAEKLARERLLPSFIEGPFASEVEADKRHDELVEEAKNDGLAIN